MKLDIVIEPNVLLTALKSPLGTSYRMLSMIQNERFAIHISAPLIAEYESVLKANAMIVTWNLADFKRAASFGIRVMTPREFLNELENPQ